MDEIFTDDIRRQLNERRDRLTAALHSQGEHRQLIALLRDVDRALGKLTDGTYGLCEKCHEPIEAERLAIDPLIRNCLDHLTEAEQHQLAYDLSLASQVQQALLPKRNLRVRGWSVAYHYEPAGHVSGDYVDVLPSADGVFLFVVGDVTGKGIAASILMSHLHATLRTLVNADLPLGDLLTQANRLFCEGTTSRYFATVACGRATVDGSVEICNAGHPSPMLLHGETVTAIRSSALPLGMFCHTTFPSRQIQLHEGDTLILYTDGITEARNEHEEMYGEERLDAVLRSQGNATPEEILKACLQDLRDFRGTAPLLDDTTMLALRKGD
jgi:sigma-B regulation protein RsbU (phosphoserine phosphatase)